ncbi:hypothetical protein [Morganella morganii IS15]|nr:hypothetical protein [Morganella morganii IS15]
MFLFCAKDHGLKKGVFTALSFDAKTTGNIKNHLLHKKQHMTSDD